MEEKLDETLKHLSDALHYFGKYAECNAVVMLGRLLRAEGLDDLEKFEKYVERIEAQN